jgi:hypothetical protein
VLLVLTVAALIAVAAAVTVGTVAVTLPGCESCHAKDSSFAQATAAAPHSDVSCVSCHVDTRRSLSRAEFGATVVFGMWVPLVDPASSDSVTIKDDACLACHREVQQRTVAVRGLRIKHVECAEGRLCTDCHTEVAHGKATKWSRVASMNDCTSCHKRSKTSVECKLCHTGKIETVVFTKPEFRVTHGPQWRKTHGMGQMDACSVCHDENKCGRCHGPGVPHSPTFLQDHPESASDTKAECTSCHSKKFCNDCHGYPMPHPKSFAPSHSGIVGQDGERPCLKCHSAKDCENCHTKHVHPGGSIGTLPRPDRDIRR